MVERLHDRLEWDVQDGVAYMTLAHDRGNPLDMPMAEAILDAAQRVNAGAADGNIRVAVLGARGQTFSVGGDLRAFSGATDREHYVRREADVLHEAILILRSVPIPVVSVVQGTVAGGGIGVALAADLVLIADDAALCLAYNAVGISPDCGTSWILARQVGHARAIDLAFTNRALTGAEAAQWGLVSRAVPRAELEVVAASIVATLRCGAGHAYGETKRLLNSAPHRDLRAHLDDEAKTVSRLLVSDEGTEGIHAFLDKRLPMFSPGTTDID